MKSLCIDLEACIACGMCITSCKRGALTQDLFLKPILVRKRCVLCGKCVEVCPTAALRFCDYLRKPEVRMQGIGERACA
ncbi:MAG: hypothetical protein DRO12_02585 [Thermoprotei archaeon]|nr:MAG: hypothetical protein DRO12_02585 [Thermoprotei archaeon]